MRTQKREDRAQRKARGAGFSDTAKPKNGAWMRVLQRLPDLRWIRVLTVVDQFTRECLCLHADTSLSGERVAAALDKVVALRGGPEAITVDIGTEFRK